jgi:hypothetical protein
VTIAEGVTLRDSRFNDSRFTIHDSRFTAEHDPALMYLVEPEPAVRALTQPSTPTATAIG